MASNFTVEINGLKELQAAFSKSPQNAVRIFNNAIKKSIYLLLAAARKRAPVDRGFLRGVGMVTTFEALTGTLTNEAPYAVFVHEGTKPHFPPMEAIAPWAESHGIPPFVLARSIAKKGTKANPFFTDAIEETQPEIDSIFDAALEEFTLSL